MPNPNMPNKVGSLVYASSPFGSVQPLKTQNDKMVKQNDTFPNTGPVLGYASNPSRYLSSNDMFCIDPIDPGFQPSNYPSFLSPFIPNSDFFQTATPIAFNLPSTLNANRYK